MSNQPGRNDPCPCGSGKKYKACCWSKQLPKARKPLNAKLLSSGASASNLMGRVYGGSMNAPKLPEPEQAEQQTHAEMPESSSVESSQAESK